ncbi:hypothetical protein PUN28_006299 [Cardiocondyla obscurior]|uniref:Uncharacterized protein n=1 Tax=Cardiocondyla obscurior TaxID=286306 RepID=A0AAW2G9T5_9HYME
MPRFLVTVNRPIIPTFILVSRPEEEEGKRRLMRVEESRCLVNCNFVRVLKEKSEKEKTRRKEREEAALNDRKEESDMV